jgi:hypothetical protein
MSPEELLLVLRERPFQPFRIRLTDGRKVDVPHPEMVLPGRRSITIGLPASGDPEPLYDRKITVDLIHIVSLEPIQPSAKPDGQA